MGLFVGLLAGIFGGLVGLGGGAIMIPLMVDFLKTTQHRAHGTSLVAVVFTGLSGAAAYYNAGHVELMAAGLLTLTAMFTARSGAHFANGLPEWKLKRSFGGFLIFMSLMMLMKPYLPSLEILSPSLEYQVAVLLVTGLFTGFLSGMMGVGGGAIMIPAMVLLLGFTQQTANGTSLLTMILASAVGAWTHYKLDNVETRILPGLIIGVLAGSFVGGLIAVRMPEFYLRLVFAAVLIWIGTRYLRTPSPEKAALKAKGLTVIGPEQESVLVDER